MDTGNTERGTTERGATGRALDKLYLLGGYLSAACLVAIVVLIALKWSTRVFGITFSLGADYAGYAMGIASFLGFAYALNHGAHIRVTLGLVALGRHRYFGEVWCFAMGALVTSWIAWEASVFALRSFERGYKAIAPHATPLWVPQAVMAVGAVLLAICFWDNLVQLLRRGASNIVEPELETTELADAEMTS